MKPPRLKKHHFHSKLLCQKPMLRQIEWWLQNGLITESGVLPVTTLFFWKICFNFRTSSKELIWCNNDPNVRICIFCKCWSLILGCFSLWVPLKAVQRAWKFLSRKSSENLPSKNLTVFFYSWFLFLVSKVYSWRPECFILFIKVDKSCFLFIRQLLPWLHVFTICHLN